MKTPAIKVIILMVLCVSQLACDTSLELTPQGMLVPEMPLLEPPVLGSGTPVSKEAAKWTPLMMRSKEEAAAGDNGSGAEQHFHGMARSYFNPDYIYITQDICGPWRSTDGGKSWEKTIDNGLIAKNSDCIDVDPVDPRKVIVAMDMWNNYLPQQIGGLFMTTDGGDNWTRVLNVKWENRKGVDSAGNENRGRYAYYWKNEAGFSHRSFSDAIAWSPVGVSPGNSPRRWYSAFPQDYLYYSDDGGYSWNQGADVSEIEFIWQVKADPFDIDTLYLGTDHGLFVSKDGGRTINSIGQWTITDIDRNGEIDNTVYPKNNGTDPLMDRIHPKYICPDPKTPGLLRAIGHYQTGPSPYQNGARYFESRDYGLNWIEGIQPKNLKGNRPVQLFQNPNPLYADHLMVTHKWGFHSYSTDGGKTWQDGNYGINHPGFGREANWRRRFTGGLAAAMYSSEDPDNLVGYSHASFWRTENGPAVFTESATGFNGIAWSWTKWGIEFDRYNPDRVGTFNCDVNVRITNTNWDYFEKPENFNEICSWRESNLTAGQGSHAGAFQPGFDSQVMIATIGQYWNLRLMRSEDAGRNWKLVDLPDLSWNGNYRKDYLYNVFFHPEKRNLVFAGNLRSRDAGKTWNEIDFGKAMNGGDYKTPPSIEDFSYNNPNTIYARAGYLKAILRSDDGGETWRHYNTGNDSFSRHGQMEWQSLYFDRIPTFAVNPDNPDWVYVPGPNGGLARCEGESWTEFGVGQIDEGFAEYKNFPRSIAIDPNDGDIIYVGKFMPGMAQVFRTRDGGISWEDISANLPRVGVSAMEVNPHTGELFVGSFIGTWVYPAPY